MHLYRGRYKRRHTADTFIPIDQIIMNAYQLWRMTANPIDPNKRARVRKLWRSPQKDYSLRLKREQQEEKTRSLEETTIGLGNEKMVHKRLHRAESTDTILLGNKRYIESQPKRKRSLPTSPLVQRSAMKAMGVLEGETEGRVGPVKWTVTSNKRPSTARISRRPEPTFRRNESRHLRGASVIVDSSSVDADLAYNRKKRRHSSPRRNTRSIKWLMQNGARGEKATYSFREGSVKRHVRPNANETQKWFSPQKLEKRRANLTTRQNIFGF